MEKGVVLLLRKGREDRKERRNTGREDRQGAGQDMGYTWGLEDSGVQPGAWPEGEQGVAVQKGQDPKALLVRAKTKPQDPKFPISCVPHPSQSLPPGRRASAWSKAAPQSISVKRLPSNWRSSAEGTMSLVSCWLLVPCETWMAKPSQSQGFLHPLLVASCTWHMCIPPLPAPDKGCWDTSESPQFTWCDGCAPSWQLFKPSSARKWELSI